MRTIARRLGIPLLGVVCAVSLVAAGSAVRKTESYIDRFRDYAQGIDQNTWKSLYTPTTDASGNDAFPGVWSKWQQPRDVGTSPHQGLDLGVPKYTWVYPTYKGWIVYQSGRKPDDTCCVYDANGQNRWEMIIQLDWNDNGAQDDAVYLKYDHLQNVGYYATGAYVTASNAVARSGDEGGSYGAHLHLGLLYPREGQTGRWTSMNHHYGWAANWRYGDDLDFISYVVLYTDNTVRATSYVRSDGQYQASGGVRLFHRRSGTSTWSSAAMSLTSEADRYVIDLDNLGYAPGTPIHWFVRSVRSGLSDPHNAGFFPTRYAHPNNDPNATSAAYPYYTATTQ